ncbi:hypothetical protein T484DRAFT_1851572, partial [Baffinella frigidus]
MLRLNYDLQISHFASKIGAWSVICALFIHWVSCLTCFVWTVSDSTIYRQISIVSGKDAEMFLGGSPECNRDTWCSGRFYSRGLRTATAFMCGHGQDMGNSIAEEFASVVFTISGSLIYVSCLSMCWSLMMVMNQERVHFMGQVHRLDHYMGRLQGRRRAREYMEMQWANQGGDQNEDILQY